MKKIFTIYFFLFAFLNIAFTASLLAQSQDWLRDVTHEVGLDSVWCTKVLWVDVNNDNYPDLLCGTGNLNRNNYYLYINIPNPDSTSNFKRIFKDITKISGINKNRDNTKDGRIIDVAAMADVNNDGNMDLVNSIYYHRLQMYIDPPDPGDRSEVYLNDGQGHFTLMPNNGLHDINMVDSLPRGLINATGMAFLDYDYDGILDLYISTWFSDYAANMAGLGEYKMKDALLKGNGDGSFTMVKNSGIEKVTEPMYGVNVTDWDNDGWQDIITSPYCRSGGSLFKNLHNGTFVDVAQTANYSSQLMGGDHGQALCQWEAQPGDFDCDMDLLQVEVHGGNDNGESRSHISINQGKDNSYRYEWDIDRLRRDAPKSTTHFGDQGGQWFDLDGDGWLDCAIENQGYMDSASQTNMQGQVRLYILKQNDLHYFDDITKQLGLYTSMKEGHSIEPGDYDLDGDQDLFFSRLVRDTVLENGKKVEKTHMQVLLLQNDIGNKNNWINIKLTTPPGVNKSCVGARITVCSEGHNQISEIQTGMGHFAGQQPFIRNFGLGQRNRIDSIIVRWPRKDQSPTIVYNPPLNGLIEIDGSGYKDVLKTWSGDKPIIAFDKAYFNFDTVSVGGSQTGQIQVLNLGDSPLEVTKIESSGDTSAIKLQNVNIPFTVNPHSSLNLSVKFTPDIRRFFNSQLKFTSNSVNTPLRNYDLQGFGLVPKPIIALDKPEISFDTGYAGKTETALFEIRNLGELPLDITNITIDNDRAVFSIPDYAGQFTIQPNEKKQLILQFLPIGKSEYIGKINIFSNGYNETHSTIALRALADGPIGIIELDKIALFFTKVDVGKSKELSFNIGNNGNADLHINQCSVPDKFKNVFTFPGLSLPITLKKGESKDVTVHFEPKLAQKYDTEVSIICDAYLDSVKTIQIKATGNIVAVEEQKNDKNLFSINITPNPIADEANVSYILNGDSPQLIRITLIDITGSKQLDLLNSIKNPGVYNFSIKTNNLSTGIYYILAQIGSLTLYLPVVIMK